MRLHAPRSPAALFVLATLFAATPALGQGRPPAPTPTPAAPTRTAAPEPPRPVRTISVKEAIVRALDNNPDIEIARLDVGIAAAQVGVAEGEFDPVFFLSGNTGKNRSPFFQNPIRGTDVTVSGLAPGLQTAQSDFYDYGGGFRQRTPIGLSWEMRYGADRRTTESTFSLNPQWGPSLGITISQPLLRGFGLDVNRAFVTIARAQASAAREGFLDLAMSIAFSVEEAYWAYVFAIENRKVAEQALRTAEDLLEVNRRKLELGRVAPIEVLVAEAGVAARQEAVIVARNEIFNARDRLLRFLEPLHAGPSAWNVDLAPTDAPRVDDAPIDPERALHIALEKRADLRRLDRLLEADAVRLDRAENDEWPRLDLVGSFTELGLGDSHHNSHDALIDGRFYDFSVGLSFELPLFNTAADAATEQARLALRQDRKRRESLELTIVLDVRTAVRDILTARERIRAADVAAELAQRQLDEQRKRLEVGLATNYDLLLFEDDLTAARTNALRARLDYEVARARLARVTGTILERRDIRVE